MCLGIVEQFFKTTIHKASAQKNTDATRPLQQFQYVQNELVKSVYETRDMQSVARKVELLVSKLSSKGRQACDVKWSLQPSLQD